MKQFYSALRNSPKLETYCLIKTDFCTEKYLSSISNINHRITLSRLRCSAHNLLIDEGRHRNIDRRLN
jgi:hypothetical protein